MRIVKFKMAVLFVCGILCLIEHVYLLDCPRYIKHEAIRDGLLNSRALCRAEKIEFNEYICLNGFKSRGFYCATGSCNIFGQNCDGHCLTGDDNTDEENDFNMICHTTLSDERQKLCRFYHDKFQKLKYPRLDVIITPEEITGIEPMGMHPWETATYYVHKLKVECPKFYGREKFVFPTVYDAVHNDGPKEMIGNDDRFIRPKSAVKLTEQSIIGQSSATMVMGVSLFVEKLKNNTNLIQSCNEEKSNEIVDNFRENFSK